MGPTDVNVPLALLQDFRLTDSDKRLWMTMRIDRRDKSIPNVYSPTRLANRSRLGRGTIYNAIARLAAAGWYRNSTYKPDAIINRTLKLGGWVNLPAELVTSDELKPRDVVMYGLLNNENFRLASDGEFTYRFLGKYAQVCVKTVRRAIRALINANWLQANQTNQLAPIEFMVDSPAAKYCREQISLTKKRLGRPTGHGEAIAMALVTLVATPTSYWANTKPDFLVNPDTGELMEVDLWLPEHNLAVEFNGRQHYEPTDFATADDVAMQQRRDALKAAIFKDKKINLVVLTTADLSIAAVVKKLKGLVPLRELRLYRSLVNYLNDIGHNYQCEARRLAAQEA